MARGFLREVLKRSAAITDVERARLLKLSDDTLEALEGIMQRNIFAAAAEAFGAAMEEEIECTYNHVRYLRRALGFPRAKPGQVIDLMAESAAEEWLAQPVEVLDRPPARAMRHLEELPERERDRVLQEYRW